MIRTFITKVFSIGIVGTTMLTLGFKLDGGFDTAMHVSDLDDPHTHLTELKQHFKLMTNHCNNLVKMGSMRIIIQNPL